MSSIFTDKKNLAGPSRHCQYLHHVELVSKFPGSIAIRLVSASSLACQASSYDKSGFYGIVGEYNLQMQLNLSFLFRVPSTVCNKTHLSHNVALKKRGKRQASVKSWHWSKSPTSAFVNYSALQGHLFVAHRELVPKRFFFFKHTNAPLWTHIRESDKNTELLRGKASALLENRASCTTLLCSFGCKAPVLKKTKQLIIVHDAEHWERISYRSTDICLRTLTDGTWTDDTSQGG